MRALLRSAGIERVRAVKAADHRIAKRESTSRDYRRAQHEQLVAAVSERVRDEETVHRGDDKKKVLDSLDSLIESAKQLEQEAREKYDINADSNWRSFLLTYKAFVLNSALKRKDVTKIQHALEYAQNTPTAEAECEQEVNNILDEYGERLDSLLDEVNTHTSAITSAHEMAMQIDTFANKIDLREIHALFAINLQAMLHVSFDLGSIWRFKDRTKVAFRNINKLKNEELEPTIQLKENLKEYHIAFSELEHVNQTLEQTITSMSDRLRWIEESIDAAFKKRKESLEKDVQDALARRDTTQEDNMIDTFLRRIQSDCSTIDKLQLFVISKQREELRTLRGLSSDTLDSERVPADSEYRAQATGDAPPVQPQPSPAPKADPDSVESAEENMKQALKTVQDNIKNKAHIAHSTLTQLADAIIGICGADDNNPKSWLNIKERIAHYAIKCMQNLKKSFVPDEELEHMRHFTKVVDVLYKKTRPTISTGAASIWFELSDFTKYTKYTLSEDDMRKFKRAVYGMYEVDKWACALPPRDAYGYIRDISKKYPQALGADFVENVNELIEAENGLMQQLGISVDDIEDIEPPQLPGDICPQIKYQIRHIERKVKVNANIDIDELIVFLTATNKLETFYEQGGRKVSKVSNCDGEVRRLLSTFYEHVKRHCEDVDMDTRKFMHAINLLVEINAKFDDLGVYVSIESAIATNRLVKLYSANWSTEISKKLQEIIQLFMWASGISWKQPCDTIFDDHTKLKNIFVKAAVFVLDALTTENTLHNAVYADFKDDESEAKRERAVLLCVILRIIDSTLIVHGNFKYADRIALEWIKLGIYYRSRANHLIPLNNAKGLCYFPPYKAYGMLADMTQSKYGVLLKSDTWESCKQIAVEIIEKKQDLFLTKVNNKEGQTLQEEVSIQIGLTDRKGNPYKCSLVIAGHSIEVQCTSNYLLSENDRTYLNYWASDWNGIPRIAKFDFTFGTLGVGGTTHPIVEIHNEARGNCLLQALGFYVSSIDSSRKWTGGVEDLRKLLLTKVEERLLGSSDSDDVKWDRQYAETEPFTKNEESSWHNELTRKTSQKYDGVPEEVMKLHRYVYIRSRNEAYLGRLEIDAFAREFKVNVCVWATVADESSDVTGVILHYSSPETDQTKIPIANFSTCVHLRYYDPGTKRDKGGHFTLLALLVKTTSGASPSFGRDRRLKRSRVYV